MLRLVKKKKKNIGKYGDVQFLFLCIYRSFSFIFIFSTMEIVLKEIRYCYKFLNRINVFFRLSIFINLCIIF